MSSPERASSRRTMLDLERVEALRVFTSEELTAIAAEVVRSVSRELAAGHAASLRGDMAALAQAAHSGRNETLLVGAREVADDFAELEAAARSGDSRAAAEALARAVVSWSAARPAVEQLPVSDALT